MSYIKSADERARRRAYTRRWKLANPDKLREQKRRARQRLKLKDPDKAREQVRRYRRSDAGRAAKQRYYRRNKQRINKSTRAWVAANPDRHRENQRRHVLRAVSDLTDAYVAHLLARHISLRDSSIPQSLIELKRAQLLIARQLKRNRK